MTSRYHRQVLLPQIGVDGQRRLAAARILLVGCGALGTVIADQLARAGVGFLRICDRDIVEPTNLQRQVLFDEEDARAELPKAVAAANRLRRVNSAIQIDPRIIDVHAGNIEDLVDVNLILDGTDNAATRYLVNDVSVKHNLPWIYGACVGTEGRAMPVVPGTTACLRCIFPDPPEVGELPTCDTAGVLAPAAAVVASHQVVAAFRLLTGAAVGGLTTVDVWTGRSHTMNVTRRDDCPCCGDRNFPFLTQVSSGVATLCGRNAIQIAASPGQHVNMTRMASQLAAAGEVELKPYFLRCRLTGLREIELTVFADGRTIVKGTSEPARARAIAARYVGS